MIQFRRLAAFILGAWLAGSMAIDTVAVVNFHSVNRLLADPGIRTAEQIHNLGYDSSRIVLRRLAGESNAWMFEQWEWTELGTGLCLLLVLVFGPRPPTIAIVLCLGMLGLVFTERFFLTPNISALGRVIDYLPTGPEAGERKKFGALHGAYSTIEIVKLGLGFAMAATLLFKSRLDRQFFARGDDAAENAGQRWASR